jgi:hypothetical protein
MAPARVGIIVALLIAIGLAIWQPVVALAVVLIPGIAIVFVLSHLAPHSGIGYETAAPTPLDLPGGSHLVGFGWVPVVSLLFWMGIAAAVWLMRRRRRFSGRHSN